MANADDITLTAPDGVSRFAGYWMLSLSVPGFVASIVKLFTDPTSFLFWFIPLTMIFSALGFGLAFVQCGCTLRHNPPRFEEWMTVFGRRVSTVVHPVDQFDCLLIETYYIQHSGGSGSQERFKLVARAKEDESKNLCVLEEIVTIEDAGARVGELSRVLNLPWQMG